MPDRRTPLCEGIPCSVRLSACEMVVPILVFAIIPKDDGRANKSCCCCIRRGINLADSQDSESDRLERRTGICPQMAAGSTWCRVEVDLSRPRTKLHLGPEGMVRVLEGGDVRLETSYGQVLASRGNARSLFPGGRRAFWWDRLDQMYFAGYALWNYLVFSALLLREDIVWKAISAWSLEGTFLRICRLIVALSSFISIRRPV
jgi:hypothetical protein